MARDNPATRPASLALHTVSEVRIFGHSHAGASGATSLDFAWGARLAKALDAELITRHVDGAVALYDDSTATGDGGWHHVYEFLRPSRTGGPYIAAWPLVVLQFGHNDAALYGADAATMTQVKSVLRAMINRARCAAVFEQDHSTVTSSGFTPLTDTVVSSISSGGSFIYATVAGSTVTITTPTDFPGGTVVLGTLTGGKGQGAEFTVTVGGTPWTIVGATSATTQDTRDLTPNFNELYDLAISGVASGTYTLTFTGQTTTPISFAASAATVQGALEALSNVVPGDVIVTGGPGNTATMRIEWTGAFKGQDITDLTADFTLMIGGTKTLTKIREGGPVRTAGNTWRLKNVPAGANTIVLTVGSNIQSFFYFDWWGIEAEVPTPVLLGLPFRLATYSAYSAYLFPLDDAAINALRTASLEVAQEFDQYVMTFDADALINKQTRYIAADTIHLSDLGHEVTAAAALAALGRSPLKDSRSAVVLAQKSADPFFASQWKPPVRAMGSGTANVNILNPATATFDGVTLGWGDEILLVNQTAAVENGPYRFRNSVVPLERTDETNTGDRMQDGAVIYVHQGTDHGDTLWALTTGPPIVVGTTALTFRNLTPNRKVLAADVANSTTSFADVTGFGFPVAPNKTYRFRYMIHYDAAATGTGSRWVLNGPAGFTRLAYYSMSSLSTTAMTTPIPFNTYNPTPTVSSSSAFTTGNTAIIEGVVVNGATGGTVIARFASETGGSAITAKAGSLLEWNVL